MAEILDQLSLKFIGTYQMVTLFIFAAGVIMFAIRRFWAAWSDRSKLDLLQDSDR